MSTLFPYPYNGNTNNFVCNSLYNNGSVGPLGELQLVTFSGATGGTGYAMDSSYSNSIVYVSNQTTQSGSALQVALQKPSLGSKVDIIVSATGSANSGNIIISSATANIYGALQGSCDMYTNQLTNINFVPKSGATSCIFGGQNSGTGSAPTGSRMTFLSDGVNWYVTGTSPYASGTTGKTAFQ